ncbi:MAG: metallophosphoesterase [Deltaproteobacteria bacterium]|nr:metallophosphoesterase [Deltaproteobacteria bacterium]
MRIGLISDTHDNVPAIEKAVGFFSAEAVDLVLHAGDYVSPFSFKPFLDLPCEIIGVWGNNDGDKIALDRVSQGRIKTSPSVETYAGKKILLGHHFETLDALVSSQDYYLIVYGHTHRPEIRREGKTLVVNPGECGGWLYGKSTVAVVDLEDQRADIIEL